MNEYEDLWSLEGQNNVSGTRMICYIVGDMMPIGYQF